MNLSRVSYDIARNTPLTGEQVREVIDRFLDNIKKELKDNGKVNINGIGIVSISPHKTDTVFSPVLGKKVERKSKWKIRFVPAVGMKNYIKEHLG